MKNRLVVLAGGAGTRLYPLSTEESPKQFTKFFHGKSLYQMTLERFLPWVDEFLVVTLEKYRETAIEQADGVGVSVEVVVEPVRKNTLAAITAAAMVLDEPFLVTPADHVAEYGSTEFGAFSRALEYSKHGVVLFGITPRFPATEYGYIQPGTVEGGFFTVERFHEKPDKELARKYVESGYLWNSGMFAVDPEWFLDDLARVAPLYLEKVEQYLRDGDEFAYRALPDLSFDKGYLERARKLYLAKLDAKWSDLGSYRAIHEYFPKDENGNVLINARAVDCRNCLVINADVCCLTDAVIVNANGRTYAGPLDELAAPKRFAV